MNFKTVLIVIGLSVAGPASALVVDCQLNSEVDGKAQPSRAMTLNLEDEPGRCIKATRFTLPGTRVEVLVSGSGNCQAAPGLCPNVGPTIGAIEVFDGASGNYSKTYGSCTRAFDLMYLQFISNGRPRVNLVVACELKR